MNIASLIQAISRTSGCSVSAPAGLPVLTDSRHTLPADVQQFYTLCGGISLFTDQPYPLTIVPAAYCLQANPIIVGESFAEDISSSWYIIADDGNGDYLTIDLDQARAGRCYDSFADCHGVAGSCPIIATSFTDLLNRLYEHRGQHWYWLQPDFYPLGDAYNL